MVPELNLSFEPLTEEQLPMLFDWLRQPHVREFYQRDAPVWENIRAQYSEASATR